MIKGRNVMGYCMACLKTEKDCECLDPGVVEPIAAKPTAAKPAAVEPALAAQIGGNHYKDMPIQPIEFIHRNKIGFAAGNIIKYVCRYARKNGVEDLAKARHYIDMLIEMEKESK